MKESIKQLVEESPQTKEGTTQSPTYTRRELLEMLAKGAAVLAIGATIGCGRGEDGENQEAPVSTPEAAERYPNQEIQEFLRLSSEESFILSGSTYNPFSTILHEITSLDEKGKLFYWQPTRGRQKILPDALQNITNARFDLYEEEAELAKATHQTMATHLPGLFLTADLVVTQHEEGTHIYRDLGNQTVINYNQGSFLGGHGFGDVLRAVYHEHSHAIDNNLLPKQLEILRLYYTPKELLQYANAYMRHSNNIIKKIGASSFDTAGPEISQAFIEASLLGIPRENYDRELTQGSGYVTRVQKAIANRFGIDLDDPGLESYFQSVKHIYHHDEVFARANFRTAYLVWNYCQKAVKTLETKNSQEIYELGKLEIGKYIMDEVYHYMVGPYFNFDRTGLSTQNPLVHEDATLLEKARLRFLSKDGLDPDLSVISTELMSLVDVTEEQPSNYTEEQAKLLEEDMISVGCLPLYEADIPEGKFIVYETSVDPVFKSAGMFGFLISDKGSTMFDLGVTSSERSFITRGELKINFSQQKDRVTIETQEGQEIASGDTEQMYLRPVGYTDVTSDKHLFFGRAGQEHISIQALEFSIGSFTVVKIPHLSVYGVPEVNSVKAAILGHRVCATLKGIENRYSISSEGACTSGISTLVYGFDETHPLRSLTNVGQNIKMTIPTLALEKEIPVELEPLLSDDKEGIEGIVRYLIQNYGNSGANTGLETKLRLRVTSPEEAEYSKARYVLNVHVAERPLEPNPDGTIQGQSTLFDFVVPINRIANSEEILM